MKLFVQTLEGDARDQFSFLPIRSISSWSELHFSFMEKFGERVSISYSHDKFMKIHVKCDELVPQFNIRFAKVLNDIPEDYRPDNQMCLVVYFDAFDKKMNYLLRDKEPKTLYQAFMTTIEIENNLKYGLTRSHFARNVFQYNVFERKDEGGVDASISNQLINTPIVIFNQVENLDLDVCMEKVSSVANDVTHVLDATIVKKHFRLWQDWATCLFHKSRFGYINKFFS